MKLDDRLTFFKCYSYYLKEEQLTALSGIQHICKRDMESKVRQLLSPTPRGSQAET